MSLAKEVFALSMLDTTGALVFSKVLKRDAFIYWAAHKIQDTPLEGASAAFFIV
jgi:hypothetical protein